MPVYEAVCTRYILYSNGGFYIYLILFYLTHILKLVIDLRDALYSVLVPIFYISAWSVRLRKFNTATCTTFRELCMALKNDRHELDDGPKNDRPKNVRPWRKRPATDFCDHNSTWTTRENCAWFMERAVTTNQKTTDHDKNDRRRIFVTATQPGQQGKMVRDLWRGLYALLLYFSPDADVYRAGWTV